MTEESSRRDRWYCIIKIC